MAFKRSSVRSRPSPPKGSREPTVPCFLLFCFACYMSEIHKAGGRYGKGLQPGTQAAQKQPGRTWRRALWQASFPYEVCGSRVVARINAASYTRGAKREVGVRMPYKCQIRKNTRGKASAVPQSAFILLSILKTPQNKKQPCFAHSRQSLR